MDERDCRDVADRDDSIACSGRGAICDRSVIAARSNCSSYSCPVPYIAQYITDLSVLHSDDELCLGGVECGTIQFKDLKEKRKVTPSFCIAAVRYDHKQWPDLSPEMQKNPKVLKGLKSTLDFGVDRGMFGPAATWLKAVMADSDAQKNGLVNELKRLSPGSWEAAALLIHVAQIPKIKFSVKIQKVQLPL